MKRTMSASATPGIPGLEAHPNAESQAAEGDRTGNEGQEEEHQIRRYIRHFVIRKFGISTWIREHRRCYSLHEKALGQLS